MKRRELLKGGGLAAIGAMLGLGATAAAKPTDPLMLDPVKLPKSRKTGLAAIGENWDQQRQDEATKLFEWGQRHLDGISPVGISVPKNSLPVNYMLKPDSLGDLPDPGIPNLSESGDRRALPWIGSDIVERVFGMLAGREWGYPHRRLPEMRNNFDEVIPPYRIVTARYNFDEMDITPQYTGALLYRIAVDLHGGIKQARENFAKHIGRPESEITFAMERPRVHGEHTAYMFDVFGWVNCVGCYMDTPNVLPAHHQRNALQA